MVNKCRKRDGLMRINKENGYAISWLISQGKSPQDISDELGFTVKQINNFIKNNPVEQPNIPISTSSTKSKTEDLMIRHTSVKKNNSVAIMTKEASERNDSMRPKLKNCNKNNDGHIFKPR